MSDAQIRDAEFAAYAGFGGVARDRTIKVAGSNGSLDVRVTEVGEPGPDPSVLLLHGIGSVSVLFAPLLPHLAGRHLVLVDWPGHGLSGPVHVSPGPGVRRQVRAVVDAVLATVPTPVDVIGHSLGGQFGLYTTLDQPDRVRRLVLLGAPGAGFEGIRPIPVMHLLATPVLGPAMLSLPMSDKAFRAANAQALGPGVIEAQKPELYEAARLAGGRRANATGTASMFHALLHLGHIRPGVHVSPEELRRLSRPVLHAWGDSDVFLTPKNARASIEAIPDYELLEVTGGHGPWLEHPDVVGTRIGDFLAH